MRPQAGDILARGTVIPAIPLALKPDRTLDEAAQRRLVRYYLSAGAGGLAVAVHTTQFAIRRPDIALFQPVLEITASEIDRFEARTGRTVVRIAGACGPQPQATLEAETAASLGYDAVLLSPGGLADLDEARLLDRTRKVGQICPVIGFYLQPAVGGRVFSFAYWQALCEIEQVVAIKVAPFNRYLTLDVMRAAALSSRCREIALYTGNDDNIVLDLLAEYAFVRDGRSYQSRFAGGLLGHWAVWTRRVVEMFEQIRQVQGRKELTRDWLLLASQITDCNSAVFDSANQFRGCIPGVHEVLRRQGLMQGIWTLDKAETLSPGQAAELDRIEQQYPHLRDDDFVAGFLEADRA